MTNTIISSYSVFSKNEEVPSADHGRLRVPDPNAGGAEDKMALQMAPPSTPLQGVPVHSRQDRLLLQHPQSRTGGHRLFEFRRNGVKNSAVQEAYDITAAGKVRRRV
ncbi:unnamed protein product [Acanthoscelides obtectus]|uniref:Uncharacterized protein n=1 Tax=Acanthoscelides obtectus TaxID=200917 RepID=A0A9P0L1Q6_ACAOB|nr:unnamed protein product [Acanthoscelides obtectus]CAK1676621.1 hypothetical protein AOBTE_LOCUS30863 [Acanthoscelides obtectus]